MIRIAKTKFKDLKLIVSDFDETVTVGDTIKYVAESAYLAKPQYKPSFDHFTQTYMKAYSEYTKDFGPRDSLVKEREFQTNLKKIEMISINEITSKGLFKDIPVDIFGKQANKVRLKPGFTDFLALAIDKKIPIKILSINWLKVFIEAVLTLNGFNPTEHNIEILVNDLVSVNGITTGDFDSTISIRTGSDKLDHIKKLNHLYNNQIMYIGDSSTDLLALLEVKYGIIIEGGSILNLLQKLNIKNDNLHIASWNLLAQKI